MEQTPESVYRYEVGDQEVRALTEEFLSNQELPAGALICAFRVESEDPFADALRNLERKILEETFGSAQNDAAAMLREYGPYEQHSFFLAVIDASASRPAGVLRIVEGNKGPLKTFVDLDDPDKDPRLSVTSGQIMAHYEFSREECWEPGTVAVDKEYRRGISGVFVSATLYRLLYLTSLNHQINHWITIFDEKPYMRLYDIGVQFEPVMGSEAFPYLESNKSYLVYGNVKKMAEHTVELINTLPEDSPNSMALRALRYGQGLEEITKTFKDKHD